MLADASISAAAAAVAAQVIQAVLAVQVEVLLAGQALLAAPEAQRLAVLEASVVVIPVPPEAVLAEARPAPQGRPVQRDQLDQSVH